MSTSSDPAAEGNAGSLGLWRPLRGGGAALSLGLWGRMAFGLVVSPPQAGQIQAKQPPRGLSFCCAFGPMAGKARGDP